MAVIRARVPPLYGSTGDLAISERRERVARAVRPTPLVALLMLCARTSARPQLGRTLAARPPPSSATRTRSSLASAAQGEMPPANPPEWHEWRMRVPSATPRDSPMLRNQHKLPRLPVVPLDDTLARLRRSCEPLARDERQLRDVERKIEQFARQGGVGRKLQDLLEKRRDEDGVRNWLAKVRSSACGVFLAASPTFYTTRSTTDGRMRLTLAAFAGLGRAGVHGVPRLGHYQRLVLLWVSSLSLSRLRSLDPTDMDYAARPPLSFDRLPQAPPSTPDPPAADPAYVAASIAKTALEFRRLIATGLLEPELAGRSKDDGELCMESYKWAFNACRVPASPSDYAVKTAETDPAAQHFVVVKRNRFYAVPVVDAAGQEFSVDGFRKAIQDVICLAEKEAEPAPPVGVLTGINRDRWAEAHAHLASNPANVKALRSIHQSAFVICLDEAEPSSKTPDENVDFSWRLWTGAEEAGNRWWDKPLQWMVYRNGEAGFVGEHSCMDGAVFPLPS